MLYKDCGRAFNDGLHELKKIPTLVLQQHFIYFCNYVIKKNLFTFNRYHLFSYASL
jgi:hypothetical protein